MGISNTMHHLYKTDERRREQVSVRESRDDRVSLVHHCFKNTACFWNKQKHFIVVNRVRQSCPKAALSDVTFARSLLPNVNSVCYLRYFFCALLVGGDV